MTQDEFLKLEEDVANWKRKAIIYRKLLVRAQAEMEYLFVAANNNKVVGPDENLLADIAEVLTRRCFAG